MWHKSFLRISYEQKFVYNTLQALERNDLKYRTTRLFVTASHLRKCLKYLHKYLWQSWKVPVTFLKFVEVARENWNLPVTFYQNASVVRDTWSWQFWNKLPVTWINARDNSQKVETSQAKKYHGKKTMGWGRVGESILRK